VVSTVMLAAAFAFAFAFGTLVHVDAGSGRSSGWFAAPPSDHFTAQGRRARGSDGDRREGMAARIWGKGKREREGERERERERWGGSVETIRRLGDESGGVWRGLRQSLPLFERMRPTVQPQSPVYATPRVWPLAPSPPHFAPKWPGSRSIERFDGKFREMFGASDDRGVRLRRPQIPSIPHQNALKCIEHARTDHCGVLPSP
jgi:hypothetical protein